MLFKLFAFFVFCYMLQVCQAVPGNIVIDKKRIQNPNGCYGTTTDAPYVENNTKRNITAFDEEGCDGQKIAIIPPTARGKVPYAFSLYIH